MQKEFNPEITLDRSQQAALAQTCSPTNEGWRVVHLICRSEVDKFILDAINTDATKEADMLMRMRLAKVAAQLYEGVTNRINYEVQKYTGGVASKEPVDVTEGLLDIGPRASTSQDFESLGGEDDGF